MRNLCQSRRTQLHAAHPEWLAVAHQHQLDAAAADVDEQMRSAVETQSVTRGLEDEASLVEAGDHFNCQASLALDAADEFGAIARLAHRAGRNGAQAVDATYSQQPLEIHQRTHREVHRFCSEPSRRERAPPEAHHLFNAVDDLEMTFAAHVRHDHMHGVGSDIDRSQPHG